MPTPVTYQRYTGNWQGSPDGWCITTRNFGAELLTSSSRFMCALLLEGCDVLQLKDPAATATGGWRFAAFDLAARGLT